MTDERNLCVCVCVCAGVKEGGMMEGREYCLPSSQTTFIGDGSKVSLNSHWVDWDLSWVS